MFPPLVNSSDSALFGEMIPLPGSAMSPKNNATQDLFSLIGEDAAARLCMVFGGTKLFIANNEASRQRLSVIVGEELAEKLIFHYQGTDLNLPKLAYREIRRRNQDVAADIAAGMTQRSAAMKYGMTDRQIRNISTASRRKR
jgi:hypothetical protein